MSDQAAQTVLVEALIDASASLARIRAGALAALQFTPETAPAHPFLVAVIEEADRGLSINGDTDAD